MTSDQPLWKPIVLRLTSVLLCLVAAILPGFAASSPPMFDITRQCGAASGRNSTAMSECVVAESEARLEILQNWSRLGDAAADRCIGASRKAKRRPYAALAKCTTASLGGPAARSGSTSADPK